VLITAVRKGAHYWRRRASELAAFEAAVLVELDVTESASTNFPYERLNAVPHNGRLVVEAVVSFLWVGDESLIGLRQQLREQARPPALTSFVCDKVLANFD
jgi:hypothetical protein